MVRVTTTKRYCPVCSTETFHWKEKIITLSSVTKSETCKVCRTLRI